MPVRSVGSVRLPVSFLRDLFCSDFIDVSDVTGLLRATQEQTDAFRPPTKWHCFHHRLPRYLLQAQTSNNKTKSRLTMILLSMTCGGMPIMWISLLLLLHPSIVEAFAILKQEGKTSSVTVSSLYSSSSSSGPKSQGRKRRQPRSSSSSSSSSTGSSGPKGDRQNRHRRRRPEEPSSKPETTAIPFDAKTLTAVQNSNEDGVIPLDLDQSHVQAKLRCMTTDMEWKDTSLVDPQPPFEFLSLDDVVGPDLKGFSKLFATNSDFRIAIRTAIRYDIFHTTPFYANLSEKAASILLLPDSSLEGSWRTSSSPPSTSAEEDDDDKESDYIRMKQFTQVLQDAFGSDLISTGDDVMHSIGALCGSKPSTHWIDIYGVQDRVLSHSWHQDFGQSPEHSKTVLWGFPPEDNYEGCGVFSHVVPLQRECIAPSTHSRMEPVLFDGIIDEQHIVRPSFGEGRELLRYRDIDVLHSAPDVTYRTSVMRFM